MTLKSIHREANNDHAVQMQEDLTEIYNFMFEKVFEGCLFINDYAKKGIFSMVKQHPT